MSGSGSSNLTISVESLSEYKVTEIGYNGVEIQEKPLNPSEHFKRIVHGIKFLTPMTVVDSNDVNDVDQFISEPPLDTLDLDNQLESSKSSNWPWQEVRTYVCGALDEVCALIDVLKMTRERRYLMPDSIASDLPAGNGTNIADGGKGARLAISLSGKRRAFQAAVNILTIGAERMKEASANAAAELVHVNGGIMNDFHQQLMALRKRWRLRRIGENIVGDLTYRSVGSRYTESGNFQVRRVGGLLQLHLPVHLEGDALLVIRVDAGQLGSWQEELSRPGEDDVSHHGNSSVHRLSRLHDRLRRAQALVFINELLTQMCNEAALLSDQLPVITCGRKLFATLFPGVQLSLTVERRRHLSTTVANSYQPALCTPLVLLLQQMLRAIHRRTSSETSPQPVTGPAGISEARRMAGPHSYHRDSIERFAARDSLLKPFLDVARHSWLQRRVAAVLEEEARRCSDPLLLIHWVPFAATTCSHVKLDFFSPGYEGSRSRLLLSLSPEGVTVVLRDGRKLHFNADLMALSALLRQQALHHHITCVQALSSKPLGWQTLPSALACATGAPRDLGGAGASLVLLSPDCKFSAVLHVGPTYGVQLFVGPCTVPCSDLSDYQISLVTGNKLQRVDLSKIHGASFASKIEGVLSSLTPLLPTHSLF